MPLSILIFSPDGLSFKRDIERRGSVPTRFMSENETEAAAAWDSIEAGHGLVAIDPQWAAALDLPASFQHPYDSSKVIYVIGAYHAIHCLVRYDQNKMANILTMMNPFEENNSPALHGSCGWIKI